MAKKLEEVVLFLDRLLNTGAYKDTSLNGLQVESPADSIKKVAFAVDAGEAVMKEAVEAKAELLVVHHGIFWGAAERINGILGRKVNTLIKGGCSLYASHLPLDAHIKVGNSAELARFLKLKKITPAFLYHGQNIGITAQCEPCSIEELEMRGRGIPGFSRSLALPFGPKKISKIGVVTGSGGFAMIECKARGLDLLISGEPKQELFHLSKELGMNTLFLGHYATETFGVLALERTLKAKFKLRTEFIDMPTGI